MSSSVDYRIKKATSDYEDGKLATHPIIVIRSLKTNYRKRMQSIMDARHQADWWEYVLLHDEEHRSMALHELTRDERISMNELWPLAGVIYCMETEKIYDDDHQWSEIWFPDRGDRTLAMTKEERAYLESKPNEFDVWQSDILEFSCTDDHGRAVQRTSMSSSIRSPSRMLCGRLEKSRTAAFFNRKGYREFVPFPDAVRIIGEELIHVKFDSVVPVEDFEPY